MKSLETLRDLLGALAAPGTLLGLGATAACLLLSALIVRTLRGRVSKPRSVLFGERVVDGVLFPVLALVLALLARWWLTEDLGVAVFRIVVPVLTSLVVIRFVVRVLQATWPGAPVTGVIERSVSWVAWLAVVLWIVGLLPALLAELDDIHWKFGATRLSLRNILEGVVSAAVVLVVALWISAAAEARLLRNAGGGGQLGLRKMAANALRALLLFIGLVLALSAAGIDLTALGVLGGAIGVGIGFGLQKLAANYVSGFVILAERSMRIGDVVKVDGFEGRITDITTRYTVIRALSGRESIVPNEMMITQRVENCSLADPKVLLQAPVSVAYGTDLGTLFPALQAAVSRVPRVLAEPGVAVQLAQFGADGLDLVVNFWIEDPSNGTGNVRSDVNLVVLGVLDAAGVSIPYPQRVLHRADGAGGAEGPDAPLGRPAAAPAAGDADARGPAAPRAPVRPNAAAAPVAPVAPDAAASAVPRRAPPPSE